jgi:hypothetical protein
MTEAFGDVDGIALITRELYRIPLTESRGAESDVDNYVENSTVEALHVFRLTWRNIGEVNAPNCPDAGDGDIHLLQIEGVSDDV